MQISDEEQEVWALEKREGTVLTMRLIQDRMDGQHQNMGSSSKYPRERSPMVRDQRAKAISKSNVKTEVHNPNKLILFDNKSRIMDRKILNSLADPL